MNEWYVADFETTGNNFYIENGYTKVWLYAICDSNSNIVNYGYSIEEFFKWLHDNPNNLIYFHNLKFDGSFILNYLLNNNYEYKPDLKLRDKKGFTTLIGEEGQYYSIKINFSSTKQIVIYDSLKLIPLKVKKIAEAFNLPIKKGEIDYDKYEINDEVLDYVFNDVKIVAYAIKYFKEKNYNKISIGSCSYNDFKSTIKNFSTLFPKLNREWVNEYRKAYRGGRSQVNPKYANKILNNVKRYDINSMYPYVISRFPMPYGEPILQDDINLHEFEIYKVHIDFTLKAGHLPTLLKNQAMYNSKGDTYYISTDSIEEIYITNIDYQILLRHYDIHYIKFEKIYGFNTSKYIFRKWVDNYYSLKSQYTGGLKLLYKLILNNLYGKFGSKDKGKKRIPKLTTEDTLILELGKEEELPVYYLPVAMAVTSFSHLLIDNAIIETGVENFVYCDTDSVHTLSDLPNEFIDNKELGKFKLEGIETISKYIRQKCYCYKDNEGYTITCAGMTDGIKDYLIRMYKDDVFNVFNIGLCVDSNSEDIKPNELKLRPKQVIGGTILVPTQFSLQ